MLIILGSIAIILIGGLTIYSYYHILQMIPKHLYQKRMAIGIVIGIYVVLWLWRLTLGFYIYMLLLFLVFDVVSLVVKRFTKVHKYYEIVYQKGFTVLVLAFMICLYGVYNATQIQVTEYSLMMHKNNIDKTIVIVSDMHLSTAVGKEELDSFLETTLEAKPDMVFLVGDIYDESSKEEDIMYSYEVFSKLTKEYPVFYVMGNHEVGHGQGGIVEDKEILKELEDHGVTVLEDQVIEESDMYIIGRKDASLQDRKEITDLVSKDMKDKLVITLDHQPIDYQAEKEAGVDLVISGHTHSGQLFPIGVMDRLLQVNDLNYGYETKGNMQTIVSSGMGVWGFPMRTSGHSEIVILHIRGEK